MAPRRDAALDLAIVLAAITAAWALTRWLVYPALAIPDYAPLIPRPITGFLVAWFVLHWRGALWESLGLRKPASWPRAIALAVALYAVDFAVSTWAVPWVASIVHPAQRPSFLAYIRGNVEGLVTWLAIAWLVGGLCEECLFRGFVLDRIEKMLGGGAAAIAIAIAAQAVLFGSLHLYAGTFAFVYASLFALTHGIFYVAGGRNLWPLILVHGSWDTVGIWSVYAG
ncbi:MAG TPA: CPBP family intramembrane glutamic endopeptidase [Usitatibacter sp.]|nr:CPBP family intramembrane glutamic endopeptidase [Usitatibacter sp.]